MQKILYALLESKGFLPQVLGGDDEQLDLVDLLICHIYC
jgi:hypothetical protein